jgi:hypothetical protein
MERLRNDELQASTGEITISWMQKATKSMPPLKKYSGFSLECCSSVRLSQVARVSAAVRQQSPPSAEMTCFR